MDRASKNNIGIFKYQKPVDRWGLIFLLIRGLIITVLSLVFLGPLFFPIFRFLYVLFHGLSAIAPIG